METRNRGIDTGSTSDSSEAKEALFSLREYEKVLEDFEKKLGHIIYALHRNFSDLTEEDKEEYFSQLKQNRELIKRAFNQNMLESVILSKIVDLTDVRDYHEETDKQKIGQDRFVRFGLDMIIELKDGIAKKMREGFLDDWKGLRAYNRLVTEGNAIDKHIGATAIAENIDLFASGLNGKAYQTYAGSIREVFKLASPEQALQVAKVLEKAVENADNKKLPSLVSTFFGESVIPGETLYLGWVAVRKILERLKLPYDELVQAWLASTKTEKIGSAVYDNLKAVIELEQARPGTCLFLHKEFGILDFGRYPIEMLRKQAEEANDTSKPYGVVMYPRNDWNGAFYANELAFKDFFKSLKGEFIIRVMECEGRMDVAKAFIRLNRKYNPPGGSGHKISLAIIGGHGTENSIRFGGNDELSQR